MPPRKRTSTGSKKSNNQNQHQQQQSQQPKFGIQHFFERHSQTQKAWNPISSSDPDPHRTPQLVPTSVSDHSKIGNADNPLDNNAGEAAEKSGNSSSVQKIESIRKCLRGENRRNLMDLRTDANDSVFINDESKCGTSSFCFPMGNRRSGNDTNTSEKTNYEASIGGTELNIPSGARPTEDLTPTVVDDCNQLEVSPEVSKSMSLKRFKFSPGMLIKQSQDDGGDEVTWKISPVNERLHSMSKHLPEMVRVLADSSMFNSLNLQQCSNKEVQTSPGSSRKLEKWLSSPPLKAPDKCLVRSNGTISTKFNPDPDVHCNGSQGKANFKLSSGVLNSRSPFSTPPSLSYCHNKTSDGFDINEVSDQLGSRQHKKALIELLDQVEDVISVEGSICKGREAIVDDDGLLNNDPAKKSLIINPEERISTGACNVNFLVLEVSEKHAPSESSGPRSSFKVLRLFNEQSGEERALQLRDEWQYSVVAPGDTVNVIGEFDNEGKCDVNREKNFLIVHPDILVSGTRVAASFGCPRRTVLDERLKFSEHSAAALMGTLLHQIFQAGLIRESPTKEFLEEYATIVLRKNLESLFACGVNEKDAHKTLTEAIPKILNWISCFRDSKGYRMPSVDFKCDEGKKEIKVFEVIDIEEMSWAPRYGLKGMIDASLRVQIKSSSHEASEMIMPLEFKTGKGSSGQTAMEHCAQVMLYTLLMSERYMKNIEFGLLYYLHTDQTQGISVQRSDLVGLIMRRNELANDLQVASTTQQLPPMLQSPNMCRGCRHLSVCSIYHKAYGGSAEESGLGDMFNSLVSHLAVTHTAFLRKWERLIDLEAKESEAVKKESWHPQRLRNDQNLTSLSSLVLDGLHKSSQNHFSQNNGYIYRFVRRAPLGIDRVDGDSLSSSSSLVSNFRSGDYVILSTQPRRLLVANGIIVDIVKSHVSVSFTKRLRLPGSSRGSVLRDLQEQCWRIDKDESMASFAIMRFNLIQLFLHNEHSSRLRKMIVELETPRFDSGCIFSQDPAIAYVWSQKSLNDDQRRAILKILTAKDYTLILGMPGTGKTSTMVHAVKALLMRGASILLTSYTNSAVDNLLIKLKAQGMDFIRIGRYEAVHEDVRENCLSVKDMVGTEEIKTKLDQTKVVAVTCLGITSPLLTSKRFDVCIMDEAGQITLPVALGPLMFVSKFVLVGDHYQLPPLVQSAEAKENGMATSLFCRLSEAHPQAIAPLHSQYRMCAAIMELSNALIYSSRLRCGSLEVENAKLEYTHPVPGPVWLMEVLNPDQPVILINTDSLPAYETNEVKAVNNPIEAYIIQEVTKALILRGIGAEDIGIITPYNSQANLIRQAISEPVEIHTIDKYQGRDKDCILISFVRSNDNQRNNSSSLLGDWHRINVALTRAKKKLIMVGSCKTLSRVPLLKLLIQKVEEQSGVLNVCNKDINHKPELKRCSKIR